MNPALLLFLVRPYHFTFLNIYNADPKNACPKEILHFPGAVNAVKGKYMGHLVDVLDVGGAGPPSRAFQRPFCFWKEIASFSNEKYE